MSFRDDRGDWYRPINPNEHTYTEGYGFSPTPPFLIERHLISRCSVAAVLCVVAFMFSLSFLSHFFSVTFFDILPMELYPKFSEAVTQFAQILAYAISLTVPFLIYALHTRIPLSAALPMRPVSAGLMIAAVFASLAVSVVAMYASDTVYLLFSAFGLQFYDSTTVLPSDMLGTILYVINMTAIPAIFEEFAFRGILMQSFRRFGDSFALICSSVLFALVHITPHSIPFGFMMGLIIGYFVLFTGSLHTGMVIHFVYNLTALASSQLNMLDYRLGNIIFYCIQALFVLLGLIAVTWLSKSYLNMFSLKDSCTINGSGEKLRCFFFTLPFFLLMVTIMLQAGAFLL